MILDKNYYFNIFHTREEDLGELCSLALSKGGDWVDLFFENTQIMSLMLKDSVVSSGAISVDYGVGIRTIKGEKTGYAYTESTDKVSMRNALLASCSIAQGAPVHVPSIASDSGYVPRLYKGRPNPAADRYPVQRDWRDCPMDELVPVLEKIEEMIRSRESRTVNVMAMMASTTSDILMYNSHGELKYETRPMGVISVSALFSNGSTTYQNQVSRSFRMGVEMITDDLLEEIASHIVKDLDARFEAKRPKGGTMKVVMGAGASGILLHEAMGHAFEADFIRKRQSIFTDSLGQRVCPKGITIVDDGTIRFNRGSLNFDDEGVPAQRTVMVEDGVLTSFLHDRISARFYGVQPTGNGRRDGFRSYPIPRMRATYMEGGDASREDIIASVEKGIYVDEFSNGQVKIGEGDFTFYVKSGYLIENGTLTAPVKDINVIGNGPEVLRDILAVGNDPVIDPSAWTCGKEQSAAVSCGIPTVLVGKLTVGGQ